MTAQNEYVIEEEDLTWLQENFPGLTYAEGSPGKISGTLAFGMEYYPETKGFQVFEFDSSKSRGNLIHDTYEIEIDLKKRSDSIWPTVYETGKRIPRSSDYHCYPDGQLCLTTYLVETTYLQNGFSLPEFIIRVVVPSFYEQSFRGKYDKWPWGEYSHGVLGLLESFENVHTRASFYKKLDLFAKVCISSRLINIYLNKDTNPYTSLCPCGSLRDFRDCHAEAFRGYIKLKEFLAEITSNEIDRQLAKSYLDPDNIIMIQGWRY